MPSASDAGADAPRCLLCGSETVLLYPSNVPKREAKIHAGELACTSPNLSVHDDIYYCRPCRLGRSAPTHDADEMDELYRDVEDHDYLVSEEERREDFRQALANIERHPFINGPGTLLEIGSSFGLFLDEARKRGWRVQGVEPSKVASSASSAHGVEVFCGTLEEFDAGGEQFDVVASWDVWEHLHDPMDALARAFRLVRPGGLLVITTVNMGGFAARVLRSRWPWYMRMHLHYFTKESLSEMVRRAGFEVLGMSTQPKTLKLGYLLSRSETLFGALGRADPVQRLRGPPIGLDASRNPEDESPGDGQDDGPAGRAPTRGPGSHLGWLGFALRGRTSPDRE